MTALDRAAKDRQRAARSRAGHIRYAMQTMAEAVRHIAKAREEGDHLTLGYATWTEYVDAEFGAERLKLAPDERRRYVEMLSLAGASQREIGHTLGVSHTQVRRDLAGTDVPPDVPPDGAEPPARSPVVEAMTGTIEDAGQRAQDHRGDTPGDPEPDRPVYGPDPDAAAGAFPPPAAAPEERTDEEGAPDHPAGLLGEVPGPGDEADVTVQPSAADPEPVPPATGSGSPQVRTEEGPGCEKCGALLEQKHRELGFLRCEGCDPEGDHLPGDESGDCRICSVCPTCGKPRWSTA